MEKTASVSYLSREVLVSWPMVKHDEVTASGLIYNTNSIMFHIHWVKWPSCPKVKNNMNYTIELAVNHKKQQQNVPRDFLSR